MYNFLLYCHFTVATRNVSMIIRVKIPLQTLEKIMAPVHIECLKHKGDPHLEAEIKTSSATHLLCATELICFCYKH